MWPIWGGRPEGGRARGKNSKSLFIGLWADWWEQCAFLWARAFTKAVMLYISISSSWLSELQPESDEMLGDEPHSDSTTKPLWVPTSLGCSKVGKGRVWKGLSLAKDSIKSLKMGIFRNIPSFPQVFRTPDWHPFSFPTNLQSMGTCETKPDAGLRLSGGGCWSDSFVFSKGEIDYFRK